MKSPKGGFMKKVVLYMIFLLVTLNIFTNELKFYINIEDEIKNNRFYYEYSKDGEIFIKKVIDLGSCIEVEKVEYKILSFTNKIYEGKGENPDISLDGSNKFFHLKVDDYLKIENVASVLSHKFLIVKVYPYIKSKNEQLSVKEIEITVRYNEKKKDFKNSYFDNLLLDKKIKNDQLLNETTNIDLIIITKEYFNKYFENFIHICKAMGFSTEIVSVEYIYENSFGSDLQEKIRNYIKKIYQEKGLRFVLIGGDLSIVPARFVISNSYFYNGDYPSDIYYGDMDGNWNKDNDNIIGESSDIEDGFLDIVVTRLPFSNEIELKSLLEKFENYIFRLGSTYLKKFLHSAASLFNDLSDGLGQLMTNNLLSLYEFSSYNNFTLFSPLVDTFHQFPYYQGNMHLDKNSFSQKLSEGFYFVNHIDHSSEYFLGTGLLETKTKYSNWDTINFSKNDSLLSILFSLGCSSNSFDKISVSKSILNAKNSPVISYTGFVRTGWTSAESYMTNFWKNALLSNTTFLGEVILNANLDQNLYFRTAINTLGFPILPIYSNSIDSFIIVEKNINDSISYKIVDSKGKKSNFLVTLFSDRRIIFRVYTDSYGNISFPINITDSTLYLGIFAKDHRLKIDTIPVLNPKIEIKTTLIPDTNLILLTLKNGSTSNIFLQNLRIYKNSSYFSVKDSFNEIGISANDSVTKLIEYRRDFINDYRNSFSIEISGIFSNKVFSDSTYIHFENDSFRLNQFYTEKNNFNISFSKISQNFIDTLKVLIKNSDENMIITDSLFYLTNLKKDQTVELKGIKFRYTGNIANLDTSNMKIYFVMRNDTDSIKFKYSVNDKNFSLKLSQTEKGIKISPDSIGYNCDVYKVNGDRNIFLKRITSFEKFFVDTNVNTGENRYFAIFYDNIERVLDTTQIYTINVKTKVERSKIILAGSYFGKLDGKSLYSKSSFNYGDFNNDGKNEIFVLSDDGRVLILNEELSDITPFELKTNPYQETTPSIGDIDGNGYLDIVLANGYFNSDTSGFVIFNPFLENKKIFPIKGYGVFTASPVIEDINDDGKNEIIIGTSKGLYILDINLGIIFSKSIVNVCGISVCKDIGKIFVNDYYGKIYGFDFYGNTLSNFPKILNHLTFSPIIVSDLENDGIKDIVVSTVDNYIFVVEENGNFKKNFPFYSNAPIYSTPRVTDLNGDGKREIISLNKDGYINILSYSGESIFSIYSGSGENYYNELVIYDFDGNSQPDIVLINNKGYLISFSSDLKSCDTLLFLNSTFTSTPLVISFDNNDNYKLVAKDLSGKIYIFDNISLGFKKVLFGKTLYDSHNSSYINGEILRLSEKDEKDDVKRIKRLKVEYKLNEKRIYLLNNIYDQVSFDLYNIYGSLVLSKKFSKSDFYTSFEFSLPSGKYIYVLKSNKSILKKDKILVLKK
ncbi:TPA: hypothetical protein DCG82_04470 [candidate division WOR-3]|uniref:Gingipain domain-containing protein n=2 Tax=Bacteria candidate phyla TaxID=1783234 RepID=A0A348MKR3_UNCW3|nr:hypothetical protein [candidate division WOR-3 bacterium]HCP17228.1 hypothetical protein [candidate division WOR-3 bacterium]